MNLKLKNKTVLLKQVKIYFRFQKHFTFGS